MSRLSGALCASLLSALPLLARADTVKLVCANGRFGLHLDLKQGSVDFIGQGPEGVLPTSGISAVVTAQSVRWEMQRNTTLHPSGVYQFELDRHTAKLSFWLHCTESKTGMCAEGRENSDKQMVPCHGGDYLAPAPRS